MKTKKISSTARHLLSTIRTIGWVGAHGDERGDDIDELLAAGLVRITRRGRVRAS